MLAHSVNGLVEGDDAMPEHGDERPGLEHPLAKAQLYVHEFFEIFRGETSQERLFPRSRAF